MPTVCRDALTSREKPGEPYTQPNEQATSSSPIASPRPCDRDPHGDALHGAGVDGSSKGGDRTEDLPIAGLELHQLLDQRLLDPTVVRFEGRKSTLNRTPATKTMSGLRCLPKACSSRLRRRSAPVDVASTLTAECVVRRQDASRGARRRSGVRGTRQARRRKKPPVSWRLLVSIPIEIRERVVLRSANIPWWGFPVSRFALLSTGIADRYSYAFPT